MEQGMFVTDQPTRITANVHATGTEPVKGKVTATTLSPEPYSVLSVGDVTFFDLTVEQLTKLAEVATTLAAELRARTEARPSQPAAAE